MGRRTNAMLLVSAVTLAGCGLGGPAYDQPPAPGTDGIVEMSTALNFQPARIAVPVGGTVEWRNTSLVTHSVTAAPEAVENPSDVSLPEGAAPFNSGDVAPGDIYRRTFDVPGVYRYVCLPHQGLGMNGVVVVGGPAGGA